MLLLVFLAAATLPAFAVGDDWFEQLWQTDEGLPDNNITGLAQTSDGYLWVATTGGLARFDGVHFRDFVPFRLPPDVPPKSVTAMLVDRQDQLWLATIRGPIVRVGLKSEQAFTGGDLQDAPPTTITQDGEQAIWIAYRQGDVVRIKDGKTARFGREQGLPESGAVCLATDIKGQLWFSRGNTVGVFRQGRFVVMLTLPVETPSITASRRGGVWIASGKAVFRFDNGRIVEQGHLPGVAPRALLEDRTGALWIGTTEKGLFRYSGSRLESVPISYHGVSTILEDREGSLWVGTNGGGLIHLKRRAIRLLSTQTGLPFESVRSMAEDTQQTLWAVGHDGLLAHFQSGRWEVVSKTKAWPGGSAISVVAAPSGGVWIGTSKQGLYRWQNGQFRVWGQNEGLAPGRVRSMLAASNGDLWLSTDYPQGLQRFRDGQWRAYNIPAASRYIRAMAEDANGSIWIGTSSGRLFRATGDSLIDETARVQGHELSIRSLYSTADGSLWIGYADVGLGRWKNGRLARVSMAQGLLENGISQITRDQQNRFWMIGDHGIFRVNVSEVEAVMDGRQAHVHSTVFRRADGLPSLQGSNDVAPRTFLSHDGHIYMATRAGLAVIRPENSPNNPVPPPVVLEQVSVDGKMVALRDSRLPLQPENLRKLPDTNNEVALPPDHHKIDFDFTALSLSSPENVHFRYRLEGLDEDWIEAGAERRATYSRLKPGTYRFLVLGCNDAGVWAESPATLRIRVYPFFWQTWWFRTIVLASLALLTAIIVHYVAQRRLRQRLEELRRQAALSAERARIAQDLHDDLGARLTEATLALQLAAQGGTSAASHVNDGLATVRQAIQSLDETVWAVNPRNNTLPELIGYIGQYGMEFLRRAKIGCNLDLPDLPPDSPVTSELRHNLFLTVKEALNNVVRHAQATEVDLQLTVEDNWLKLVVSDNGCGFALTPQDGLADGLRSMRRRAEGAGGKCSIESRVGQGTRISIAYPWSGKGSLANERI